MQATISVYLESFIDSSTFRLIEFIVFLVFGTKIKQFSVQLG